MGRLGGCAAAARRLSTRAEEVVRQPRLRLGADYRPTTPKTYFAFPNDEGSFERATLRCVGIGKCRVDGGQIMCPSYMVTREEEHSTRGRARVLFEMLQGEVIDDGWKSDA